MPPISHRERTSLRGDRLHLKLCGDCSEGSYDLALDSKRGSLSKEPYLIKKLGMSGGDVPFSPSSPKRNTYAKKPSHRGGYEDLHQMVVVITVAAQTRFAIRFG